MRFRIGWVAVALAVGTTAGAMAQTSAAGSADIDPDAMAALQKMGEYMRTLRAFQVHCDTVREDVLTDGQKVSFHGKVDLLVSRPDRLREDIKGDLHQRLYLYNGKNVTIWAGLLGYYTTVPAPPTLRELADRLADKYGIELPLEDLFYWGTDQSKVSAITAATDIGPGDVEGVTCGHYIFRQPGVDWQIWIQLGDYPLPRKFIITTMTDEARPQYSNTMTWNLAPSFNDAAFQFDPPPGSHKISIAELPASSGK
jgi:hypothetical protein